MLDEQEFISRLESADADELAMLVARPTGEEERILRLYLGNHAYQRLHGLALRRELRHKANATVPRGNVVVVPGIFGCELSSFDQRGQKERIWLSARSIAAGHFERLRLDPSGRTELNPAYSVRATGIMKRSYGELILTLAEQWNVHVFWYDWRKDFRIAAAQLQARMNTWFAPDEPVHFVAHAEGGLVVRSYIAQYGDSWGNAHCDDHKECGRLVMIGTPNYGLYSAIQALTGQLDMIHWLDLLDDAHDDMDIRGIISSFPSLYQLLPAPSPNDKLDKRKLDKLYNAQTYGARPNVSQAHLDSAKEHHELLQNHVDTHPIIYVAGYNRPTVVDVKPDRLPEEPPPELDINEEVYEIDGDGDGRVSHKLGILQAANGEKISTYYLDAGYGELHRHPSVLSALDDLLSSNKLTAKARKRYGLLNATEYAALPAAFDKERFWTEFAAARRASKQQFTNLLRRMPTRAITAEQDTFYTIEDSTIEENLSRHLSFVRTGTNTRAGNSLARFKPPEIEINVVWGNIVGIDDPIAVTSPTPADETPTGAEPIDALAVGHYSGGTPETAMQAIDCAISTVLAGEQLRSESLAESERVLYQFTQRGTIQSELAQTFLIDDPRTKGTDVERVIAIAGMGAPGRFGTPELTVLVRELCWTVGRIGKKHLATVLIGAGNGNLSVSEAVAAWLRGLKFALTGIDKAQQPILQKITFCELNPIKAHEIDKAIQTEVSHYRAEDRMSITYHPLDQKKIDEAILQWQEAQRQESKTTDQKPSIDQADVAPTRITVSLDGATYHFGAITEDASIPEREIPLDPELVQRANDELAAETDPRQQLLLGQFMERLLIPADLRNELTGPAPIVMMLDATTARIHWELLGQTTVTSAANGDFNNAVDDAAESFWATSRGFTRQLRTVFAPPPEPPPPNNRILRVLIVADPASDARLPGAEEEGIVVADLFESFNLVHANSDNRIEVVRLFGPNEATRTAVLRHLMMRTYDVLHFAGHCVYDPDDPANSGWIFSGGQRLTAHEFNRIDRVPKFVFSNACESGITPLRSERRSVDLAPSFAEVFFARGVSNFVCTAWPVDDRAAREFALTLYANLLGVSDETPLDEAISTVPDGATADGDDMHRQSDTLTPQSMYKAMQKARLHIAKSPIYDIRTWGAYQHYGNPYFRFFDPSSIKAHARPSYTATAATDAAASTDVDETEEVPKRKGQKTIPSSTRPPQKQKSSRKQKTVSKKKQPPESSAPDANIYFNGIDGRTGTYSTPPISVAKVASLIKAEKQPPVMASPRGLSRGLPSNLELQMDDIRKVGWALVYHADEDPAVLDALDSLYQHRLQQVGDEQLVRKLDYQRDEALLQWLQRHNVAPGSVNPQKIPFYLLLVGSPRQIPFSFGHQLDFEYAVGRLHFDSAAQYAQYAQSVISYETKAIRNAKEAVFFATSHDGDPVTRYSANDLVAPLVSTDGGAGDDLITTSGFMPRVLTGEDATKRALTNVLLPASPTVHPPAFLFTAAHGVGWKKNDKPQRSAQGALVCQDWLVGDPVEPSVYLSAADLTDKAQLHGLIAFMFACYGAGTPTHDRFFHRDNESPTQIAPEPFFAALPQRLLSHPNGSALACIGHIERTWVQSFKPQMSTSRLDPFNNAIATILQGMPVGLALANFNDRFASLSAELSRRIEQGAGIFGPDLVDTWLLRNDAEGYILLGDPAVHLRVDDLQSSSST